MAIDNASLKLLKESAETRRPVYLSADGIDIVFQTTVTAIEKEHVALANTVLPQYIRKLAHSKQFGLLCNMVRFATERIDSDGERILFPLKTLHVIEETRAAQRFPFDAEEQVVCEILNPFDNKTTVTKTVMDMSAMGLSLRTTFPSQLFRPGVFLPDMRVLIGGETYSRNAGRVVYMRKLVDARGKLRIQVGVKFEQPAQ